MLAPTRNSDDSVRSPTSLDDFAATESWVGPVVVVTVRGSVDLLTAPRLRESIRAAVAGNPTGVIVDLTKAEFLASAGMTVLILAHETITPAVRFAVVADGPATSRPIRLMGLDVLLSLHASLDDAHTAFAE